MGRFVKIIGFLTSFVCLTGFIPVFSLIGPSVTVFTSGNFYKAGAQFFIDKTIQKKTGKNSLEFLKEKIEKKDSNDELNEQIKLLVEKRIKLARIQLNLENINQ